MEDAITTAFGFLAAYGYVVIFAWMFADQAALPVPAIPILVAGGALSATGELDLIGVIAAASVASVLADSLWYVIGWKGGNRAIGSICKLSLEPDSCVTTTRNTFAKLGPATLIVAKYIPGVQTLAPASTGFARANFFGFLLLDSIGTLLFVLPFCLGGYYFQSEISGLIAAVADVSGGAFAVVVAVLGIYGVAKAAQWVVFFRGHRLRRLTTDDLKQRLDSGEPITVIDLRQRFDYEREPRIIPGALRIPINEVPARRADIPSGFDIVLVCT